MYNGLTMVYRFDKIQFILEKCSRANVRMDIFYSFDRL